VFISIFYSLSFAHQNFDLATLFVFLLLLSLPTLNDNSNRRVLLLCFVLFFQDSNFRVYYLNQKTNFMNETKRREAIKKKLKVIVKFQSK
jgi:hypothetical protein